MSPELGEKSRSNVSRLTWLKKRELKSTILLEVVRNSWRDAFNEELLVTAVVVIHPLEITVGLHFYLLITPAILTT